MPQCVVGGGEDEGTSSLLPREHALAHQFTDSLADRRAADLELGGELIFGAQLGSRRVRPVDDPLDVGPCTRGGTAGSVMRWS